MNSNIQHRSEMRTLSKDELLDMIEEQGKEIAVLNKEKDFLKRALALAMNGNSRGILDMMGEANDENPISEILDSHIAKHSEAWEGLGHA